MDTWMKTNDRAALLLLNLSRTEISDRLVVMISQAFFDDVCLENAELLGLSNDDAVTETLQQLGAEKCAYLVQTFPSEDCLERRARRDFLTSLERLSTMTDGAGVDGQEPNGCSLNQPLQAHYSDANDTAQLLMKDLKRIQKHLEEDYQVYIFLFEANRGVERLAKHLSDDSDVLHLQQQALATLLIVLQKPSMSLRQQLQDSALQMSLIKWFKATWTKATANGVDQKQSDDLRNNLLTLVYHSCKGNQFVKHVWMQDAQKPTLANLLVETLSQSLPPARLVKTACQLLTVLGTFDDSSSTNRNDPSIATSHSHVQTLYAAGVLNALKHVLQMEENQEVNATTTSIINAIRCLAVHNDIVQAIVSNGILQRVVDIFQKQVESMDEERKDEANKREHSRTADIDQLLLLAACLGFFRNVCANDDLKYKLCAGTMSIAAPMINCMQLGMALPSLQEHAIGTMAAMALRQPQNAAFLIASQGAPNIVQAMRKYPNRSSLQRQGCLAIRNLASRAEAAQKEDLLALTRETLQTIAAKHLECQDEVYAALREMGVHQAHVFAVQDAETGAVLLQERLAFGQGHNANFRSVYE
ncbi:hypothetical protein MPSEU_000079900 [Mayamaea pseudoterrestris]|nr:hypothetical protein MPSEU_000079900 [Mayamaea pseudoterrestris]